MGCNCSQITVVNVTVERGVQKDKETIFPDHKNYPDTKHILMDLGGDIDRFINRKDLYEISHGDHKLYEIIRAAMSRSGCKKC